MSVVIGGGTASTATPTPSQADWQQNFVYGPPMGITTTVLPTNSIWLNYAYQVASALVSPLLAQIPGPFFLLATYNLAGDNLINYAQDLTGAAIVPGSNPPAPFFQNLRNTWKIYAFTPGVVASSSDEGTSESLLNIDVLKGLTLSQLQNLKTPFGRDYLKWAQAASTQWGSS